MVELKNKRILFIAPAFFGYENEIVRELRRLGAEVSYVQENIDSTSFFQKIINKMPLFIRNRQRTMHFLFQFKKLNLDDYDIVFCIRINLFNELILRYLRNHCKKAKFILYYWDSINNMRNAEKNAAFFDNVFTFDKNDYLKNKDKGWLFRPLFYIDSFKDVPSKTEKNIDLLFVATLSPARARLFLKLDDFCKRNKLQLLTYFYIKPYVWLANKKKYEEYKLLPKNILHGSGMSLDDVCRFFQKSKVVIDCSSPTQSGLTMRTIECFGANKKIVTTNKTIDSYDFYDLRNHLILDTDNENELLSFIQNESYSIPNTKLYNKYSLRGWVEDIFSNSDASRSEK